MGYQLYDEFGDLYDLHTPSNHYENDHKYVIAYAREQGGEGRLLDVGCGTGILVEKAMEAGLRPIGLDPASKMVAIARQRIGKENILLARMQELEENSQFDCIASLSWTINYCCDAEELRDVLSRCHRALKPEGGIILQVAHAPNAPSRQPDFNIDSEYGPGGENDIQLRYRFWSAGPYELFAEYQFECISTDQKFEEIHSLHVANAQLVAEVLEQEGFHSIEILEDWRGQKIEKTLSPFVIAKVS